MHIFHPTILREYDIRGIVGETLFAADAFAIGKAFGTRVRRAGGKVVCVGWDGRLSSPELAAAVRRRRAGHQMLRDAHRLEVLRHPAGCRPGHPVR